MKIEDVGIFINHIAKHGMTEDCVFTYFEPLFQAINNDQEIARRFATISNTHTQLLELFGRDEDSLELITACIERWSDCSVILSNSKLASIRIKTARKNHLIALQLINDSDPDVRLECARLWACCAEKLLNDSNPNIRLAAQKKLESEKK